MSEGRSIASTLRRLLAFIDRFLLNPAVLVPLIVGLLGMSAYFFYLAYRDYQRSLQPPPSALAGARHWLTVDELLSQWYNAKFVPAEKEKLAASLRRMPGRNCAEPPEGGRPLAPERVLPKARTAFYRDMAGWLAALAEDSFDAYRRWYEQEMGFHVGPQTRREIMATLRSQEIPFGEDDDGWKLLQRLWDLEQPRFAVVAVAPEVSCVLFWEGPASLAEAGSPAEGSQARHGFQHAIPGRQYVEPGVYGHAKLLHGDEQSDSQPRKLLFADVVLIAKHGGPEWNDQVCPYYIRLYYDPLCDHWHPISMGRAPAAFRIPQNQTFWY